MIGKSLKLLCSLNKAVELYSIPTYVFGFGLSKIVGERRGVVLVNIRGHFVKARDEGVLDPIDDKFHCQHQEAIGS
jgi:hypothetical protein